MAFLRDWACWVLLALAAGCFLVGGFPQRSDRVDPASGDKLTERRYGLIPLMPLYESVHREFANGGSKTESWTLNFFSLSSLLVLFGLLCLAMIPRRLQDVIRHRVQQHGAPANQQRKRAEPLYGPDSQERAS